MNKLKSLLPALFICMPALLFGQTNEMLVTGNIFSDDDGGLIGVNVLEIDKTDRTVSATITDFSGNFSLQIKNAENRISVSYVGFKTVVVPIGNKRRFDIKMEESTILSEVVITARVIHDDGTFAIPKREIAGAVQRLNTDEFVGVSVASIEDALQGRIAGLDIVGSSGNLGSGSTLRIRGTSSLNSRAEPLIVVNDVPFENNIRSLDLNNATEEQFANLLNINPDDIQEIVVLKDGASAAIWGARGANGVISIRTKKGVKGPTRIQYGYRFSGKQQPPGIPMLNGDEYTMMMKQAYFNPNQSETSSTLPEFSYDPSFYDYHHFNNNTDWVKAVTQYGLAHDHNLTVSGGGDKATFRMSLGYLGEQGTVIKQNMDRITSLMNFEYRVSDRIRFTPEFAITYINNHKNLGYDPAGGGGGISENLLSIAYKKMPNVSIYRKDAFGNDTDQFFIIPDTRSQSMYAGAPLLDVNQRRLANPVAFAHLGMNNNKTLRVKPKLSYLIDLLDPEKTKLRYSGYVAFDYNSENQNQFFPRELFPDDWQETTMPNRSYMADKAALTLNSDQNITWVPQLGERNVLTLYASWQLENVQNISQDLGRSGLASSSTTDPSLPGEFRNFGNNVSERRMMAFLGRMHYSLLSRYILDASFRREGDSRFGPNNRWGNFYGASAKWIMTDERFMDFSKSWLTELGWRVAYGVTGNAPGDNYLHFSRYNGSGTYIDISAIRPVSVQLADLKWETSTSYNAGFDIILFDRFFVDANIYKKRTEGLLLKNLSIPTSTGFGSLSWINGGTIDNDGWELNASTQNLVKAGGWTFDLNFNFANNVNTFVSLDPAIAQSYNSDFVYSNTADYLSRIQEGNALGSIYGFRYKGVYQYDKYLDNNGNPNPGTTPFAIDANGNTILDGNGNPIPMTFAYGSSMNYTFRGGDAIYEDINNDGTIDELDIVYLGNSNPKLTGGFGASARYKKFLVNAFFNFRYGNKIINQARRDLESMYSNNNQSIAVNWRWLKDGDQTGIPRALYNYGYNTLPSDRFVEDGSFMRFKYLTFVYNFDKQVLKPFGVNQLDISLTLNDLMTFSKYRGVNPEVSQGVSSSSSGLVGVSVDNNRTPKAQYFTLGITIGF